MSETKKERMTAELKEKIRFGNIGKDKTYLLGNNHAKTKKVICLNNNKIYNTIKQASDELNLSGSNIINVCKGLYKQTKGYMFKYYEE